MWRTIDLVLRFIYVALIPMFLGVLAALMPMTGIIVSAAIATAIALAGSDRWRARVGHLRFVGKPLANLGRLGDFYSEHPPKPLIYYVLYPVLIPYWLIAPVARREFLLYRKLNAVAFFIIVAGGAHDYWVNYRPSIGFKYFAATTVMIMVFQIILTFAIITPIVTTFVTLRKRGHLRTMWALLVCVALTGTLGVVAAHHTQTKSVKLITRIKARVAAADGALIDCHREHPDSKTCGTTNGALMSLAHALDAAYASLGGSHGDTPEVRATALDVAKRDLEVYFKADEADAFEMFVDVKTGVLMLYVDLGKNERVMWLGRNHDTVIFPTQPELLPAAGRRILEHQRDH